jgi:hypothetical protein
MWDYVIDEKRMIKVRGWWKENEDINRSYSSWEDANNIIV